MEGEHTQEFRQSVGESAMRALDNVDDEMVIELRNFFAASRRIAKVLSSKEVEPDDVVSHVAGLAASAAYGVVTD